MGRLATLVFILLSLAYPLVVYAAMGRFEPRWLAGLLAGMALLRAVISRQPFWLAVAAGALLLALAASLSNEALPLKLYPALVNAALLVVFATSLRYPPTAIERLARLQEPDLPPRAVAYTRKVTWVWCGFFLLNGFVATGTALWASQAVWAFYNGLLAYLMMGILFAVEWCVRQRVRSGERHG